MKKTEYTTFVVDFFRQINKFQIQINNHPIIKNYYPLFKLLLHLLDYGIVVAEF